jgi:dihydroorotase
MMMLNPNDDARSLLIQNAQILLPSDDFLTGEVWVKAGKIDQVGVKVGPMPEGMRSIDATGLLLLPETIDPQVHFREPLMG